MMLYCSYYYYPQVEVPDVSIFHLCLCSYSFKKVYCFNSISFFYWEKKSPLKIISKEQERERGSFRGRNGLLERGSWGDAVNTKCQGQ
jgi:hypothetical protein